MTAHDLCYMARTDKRTGLTDQQEAFCREYSVDFNGRRAAEAAGYTKRRADVTASELLRKPTVQRRLAEMAQERKVWAGVTKERIIEELARIAFADISKVMKWDKNGVTISDSKELAEEVLAAIAEIKDIPGKFGSTRAVKLHGKLEALQMLGRHFGLFVDRVEITNNDVTADDLDNLTDAELDRYIAGESYAAIINQRK